MLIWKGGWSWDWEGKGGWGEGRGCWPRRGSTEVEGGEGCIETMATFVVPPVIAVVEDVWRWLGSRLGEAWLHKETRGPAFERWRGQARVLDEEEGSARGDGHRRCTFDLSKDCDERWSTCGEEKYMLKHFLTQDPVYVLQLFKKGNKSQTNLYMPLSITRRTGF